MIMESLQTEQSLEDVRAYIRPARGPLNESWRYLINLILIAVLSIIGSTMLLVPAMIMAGTMDYTKLPPLILFALTLGGFPITLGILLLGLWLLHRRKLKSLTKPVGKFNWKKVWLAAGLWLFLLIVSDVISYALDPGNYAFTLNWSAFLPYLIIGLLLIPIQTSTEELVFRGY